MPEVPRVPDTNTIRALEGLVRVCKAMWEPRSVTRRFVRVCRSNHEELKSGSLPEVLRQTGSSEKEFIAALG